MRESSDVLANRRCLCLQRANKKLVSQTESRLLNSLIERLLKDSFAAKVVSMEQTTLIPSFFDALLLLWRMPSREQPESSSLSFDVASKDRVGEMLTRTFKLVVCKTFTRLYCLEQSDSHPIESSFFWQVVGSIIDTSVQDIDTMTGA